MRNVTSRWETNRGLTDWPAMSSPKFPWTAWLNQIQYRSQSGWLRLRSFSRATMVEWGIFGLDRNRASGLPDSATSRKTRIVARSSTTTLMANRRRT